MNKCTTVQFWKEYVINSIIAGILKYFMHLKYFLYIFIHFFRVFWVFFTNKCPKIIFKMPKNIFWRYIHYLQCVFIISTNFHCLEINRECAIDNPKYIPTHGKYSENAGEGQQNAHIKGYLSESHRIGKTQLRNKIIICL